MAEAAAVVMPEAAAVAQAGDAAVPGLPEEVMKRLDTLMTDMLAEPRPRMLAADRNAGLQGGARSQETGLSTSPGYPECSGSSDPWVRRTPTVSTTGLGWGWSPDAGGIEHEMVSMTY